MKSINFINGEIFPKKVVRSVLAGVAFLFATASVSCQKTGLESLNKAGLKPSELMRAGENHGRQHVNVRSMGAVADGTTDDTKAFQKAIDLVAAQGGGTVFVPPGTYSINPDTSINLKSNVIFRMADSARLIADTTSHERYYIIKAVRVHDVQILGGQIIGDRDYHIGTSGEHGYGIAIQGCDNALVKNTNISNCWGDGLIVGGSSGKVSTNVTIKSVVSDNNRRQGMSIFNVNGLLIDSCQFSNTKGTKPGDGIDIEPDGGVAENITITNCKLFKNEGNGIEMNAKPKTTAVIRNVTVQKNEIYENKYSGYCQYSQNITFTDNWMYKNKYAGNWVRAVNCTNSVFNPNIYHAP